MNRVAALALVTSTGVCALLATRVSATPPPGFGAPPTIEWNCSDFSLHNARIGVAMGERQLRTAEPSRPVVDFLGAMKMVDLLKMLPDWRVWRTSMVDSARKHLRGCGQSDQVPLCEGFELDPHHALEMKRYDSTVAWAKRVARVIHDRRREVAVCGGAP